MSVWDQGVEPTVKKKEVEEEPVEEASPSTYLFED
jgi:hypothetical protein